MEHGAKQNRQDLEQNRTKFIGLGTKLIGTDKTEQNKADGNKNNKITTWTWNKIDGTWNKTKADRTWNKTKQNRQDLEQN